MKARAQYYKECEEAIRSSVVGGGDRAISEIIDLEILMPHLTWI